MIKSNYDKFPSTKYDGSILLGWDAIVGHLLAAAKGRTLAVDLYTGTFESEIEAAFAPHFGRIVRTRDLMLEEGRVREMTRPFMTDDVLFGYVTNLRIQDFFEGGKLEEARLAADAGTLIIGTGAALAAPDEALVVYADMARWEIQQRFRSHLVDGLGVRNSDDPVSIQYKRGLFIDWKVLDLYKDKIFGRVGYWLDTNDRNEPKLIDKATFMEGIDRTVRTPFRVVPFFDPAPWGGQWMKEFCDLDRGCANYGWCFDCVPEENSLLFEVGGAKFEIPANDLVLLRSKELLGEPVEARFGKDFPIRFDFLDTMGGGNLSLQVHPTAQFIRENMGMPYTQDESYYLLDAGEGATVFLGVKTGVDKEAMFRDLRAAQGGGTTFDAEEYVNRIPARKHDHFLIPSGTIHCSGAGTMVLEISATPNIFTFKLWDWNRLGLDGKPRPINVDRGEKVVNWGRDTEYVHSNLVNQFTDVAEGDGWREIKTGLHPNEFIQTHRISFVKAAPQRTRGSVHVLNLVEGEEAVVESPSGAFEPFTVHYAETFIVPACLEEYTVRPSGPSVGKQCVVVRASVRFRD